MKYLVAGLGSIGRRHLQNLLTLGEKDIILFRTGLGNIEEPILEGLKTYQDLNEALDQKPDAVIISNPTASHLSVAIPASERGCHLLLEKPVSNDFSGIEDLQRNLKTTGKHLLMGFQFRFHPVLQQIKNIIDLQELGKPLSVHVHWGEYLPGWHPWEDFRQSYSARPDLGGGVVLTLCHPFDYLGWLLGNITSVSATVRSISDLNLPVEDVAEIVLQFSNGCLGSVHLDYFQRPPSHSIEIRFSDGIINWSNESGKALVTRINEPQPLVLFTPNDFSRNKLFLDEMAHFVSLVNNSTLSSVCSLDDGIKALQIAMAVYESNSKMGIHVLL